MALSPTDRPPIPPVQPGARMSLGTSGIQIYKNNQAMLAEENSAVESAVPPAPDLLLLAAHVHKAANAAVEHRQQTGVTDRLLESQRQRKGEYDPDKLQEIKQTGGTDLYFNITDTKCFDAEAWIEDTTAPIKDRPWALMPTPIPDLPNDLKAQIAEMAVGEIKAQAMREGRPVDAQLVYEVSNAVYDREMRGVREAAQKRADRAAAKIEDLLVEGGFLEAYSEFRRYLCTYQMGILKGPVMKRVKRTKWAGGRMTTVEEVIPTWQAVNPHDFYPAPNTRSLNRGYTCERYRIDKSDLSRMRGVDGWNTEEIEEVLRDTSGDSDIANRQWITGDAERAQMEDRQNPNLAGGPGAGIVEGWEFWGCASTEMLREWESKGGKGLATDELADDYAYHEIQAIILHDRVVKAVLNPDPLGRRIYYAARYENVPGSVWGKSIPEKMRDCQIAYNASIRNMLDNMAMTSGPQGAVDVDVLPEGEDPRIVVPWRIWRYHGNQLNKGMGQSGSRKPVEFFNIEAHIQELLEIAEYFEGKADDRTLIPRFIHGNQEITGAGETASGLSMLMNAAAKGIKSVIGNIDRDVIRPLIEQIYTWLMIYSDDEEIKGDCRVVARGATGLLVREQTQLRRQEFLNNTANPTDLQIIGLEGRAEVLRAIAADLDMPQAEIVPDKQKLMAKVQQMQMQAQAETQMAAEGQPERQRGEMQNAA